MDIELNECVGRSHLDERFDEQTTAAIISDFLRELDEFSRVLFMRRYWYMESIQSLSERYEASESKVKSNLFRTRKALRKRLLEEGVVV